MQIQTVQSLVRGLAVIRAFDAGHPRRTLAQVAEATGLARATTRRFLHTLIAEGYADTDGTEFWLTPKMLELGYAYLSSLGLPTIAQPHLEALSRTLNESCSLSVLDGTDVVYVARSAASRIMSVNITIGTRFPAHATSMGRVLMAGLDDATMDEFLSTPLEPITPTTITNPDTLRSALRNIRDAGWCVVDQELEVGLRSIAAPVRDAAGNTVAAVNVSTHIAAHPYEDLVDNLLPKLVHTADAITRDLAATTNHI